jgi:hypothetical protein
MKTNCTTPLFSSARASCQVGRFLTAILFLAAIAVATSSAQATELAYSNFGPGNTYGAFGQSVGGQFVNGYRFTSAAAGPLAEIAVGIGGSGTFDLTLYTDSAGALGSSIWSTTNVPVGLGSPNPAVISIDAGPPLAIGQSYWLVASGPANTAYWSPNTIGATGTQYHHDSGSEFYVGNTTLGAFAVSVVPEPATLGLLLIGLSTMAFRRSRGTNTPA